MLARMPRRLGPSPRIGARHPSLQLDQSAPDGIRARLLELAMTLEGVRVASLREEGVSLVLAESLAGGQPEAFLNGREFAVVRADGSVHLVLAPSWGQKVMDRSWAAIHPLARYMAGAISPGNLIVYAPRNSGDLRVVWQILQAAHAFAIGTVGRMALPDSRW